MKFEKNALPKFQGGHRIITWAAMQALPDWQREIWQDHQYKLAEDYALYGDTYYGHEAEIGPFVEMPDGSTPLWAIGVLRQPKNYGHAVDFWESPFYEFQEKTFVYFLDRIASCVAEGDILCAAQFAGSMAHHVEDSGVPAHAPDNGDLQFVKDYFPFPEKFVCFPLHGYSEASPPLFLINDYKPKLYGRTPAEAGANYIHRYVELTLFARTLLIPIAQCAYENNETKAAELRLKAAKMCAYAYADYMYTATCIGKKQFDAKDVEALREFKLTDAWPFRQTAWAPTPYFETAPLRMRGINLDMARNPVPCELLVAGADGAVASRQFKEALGAGAYYEYHYRLPAGTYQRFTGLVGIHATLKAMRSINVEVKLNGKTAWSDVIKPDEPAKTIDIAIDGARDIQLIASGPWYTEPDGFNNHVVWALPRVSF